MHLEILLRDDITEQSISEPWLIWKSSIPTFNCTMSLFLKIRTSSKNLVKVYSNAIYDSFKVDNHTKTWNPPEIRNPKECLKTRLPCFVACSFCCFFRLLTPLCNPENYLKLFIFFTMKVSMIPHAITKYHYYTSVFLYVYLRKTILFFELPIYPLVHSPIIRELSIWIVYVCDVHTCLCFISLLVML